MDTAKVAYFKFTFKFKWLQFQLDLTYCKGENISDLLTGKKKMMHLLKYLKKMKYINNQQINSPDLENKGQHCPTSGQH